jgi:hypothetical protein
MTCLRQDGGPEDDQRTTQPTLSDSGILFSSVDEGGKSGEQLATDEESESLLQEEL